MFTVFTSLISKAAPYIAGALAVILLLAGVAYMGVLIGKNSCKAEASTVVIQDMVKSKRIREEIEKDAPPPSADMAANLNWLRQNAVR